MDSSFSVEPERKIPVVYDVDVAVVGGGTAGVIAAIAAARTGASTVLVERFGSLGGCPTVGRMASMANRFLDAYLRKTIAGIPLEVLERLVKAGGTPYSTLEEALTGRIGVPYTIPFDPEVLAYVLLEMVEGEYTLTWEDVNGLGGRFEDAIYLYPGGGIPGFPRRVPYRIMVPKKVENLLVAGKCASGAVYVRSIVSCMAMGQAAGTAAALASRKGVSPQRIDIKDLQASLRRQGVILETVEGL